MARTVLDAREALALIGQPDAVGVLAGDPLLAVAAETSEEFDAVAVLSATLPCVTVAVSGEGPGPVGLLDVKVQTAGELDLLRAAVDRSPQAAVALVQLLRMGVRLDLHSALVAESLVYGLLQSGQEFRSWLGAQPSRQHVDTGTPVRVERAGHQLCLTLDRPAVHNAFDAHTRDCLVEAFTLAGVDPSIALVELRGEGVHFCAGGDLSEFGTALDPVVGHLVRTTRSAARAIAACADRTSAFLHGACIGAGIELPAFAARVVAAPDTTISLPEVGMGLVPGAGGTASLPRRIGRQRTAWLALSGDRIDAETALDWGLVDEIGT